MSKHAGFLTIIHPLQVRLVNGSNFTRSVSRHTDCSGLARLDAQRKSKTAAHGFGKDRCRRRLGAAYRKSKCNESSRRRAGSKRRLGAAIGEKNILRFA